ncbi:Dynein [Diplonema papillatum]|nr:Dynein [Diplonema papillatum]
MTEGQYHEPSKEFVTLPGTLQLDAEELSKQIDRILKATNPNVGGTHGEHKEHYFSHKKDERCFKPIPTMDQTAFHLVVNGNAIGANDTEAIKQQAEHAARVKALTLAEEAEKNPELVEQEGVSTKILKNQFNFTDRASQTFNNPLRHRDVITEPPPIVPFSSNATQWDIFDAYREEEAQQKAALGKKTKSSRDDKKRDELVSSENTEDILNSQQMLLSLKIMERMVNQNSCHDITDDYKYWDDMGDPFKPDSGTLLPLWKFTADVARKKTVTSICWNPKYNDLFAVGYGSYEFLKQGTGVILCWSLKNWSYPEYSFTTESGVMCIDFHQQHASLLACGLYDGTVMVFDVRQNSNKPIYMSTVKTGKHMDPVWQVYWAKEETGKNLSFYSVSSDGRVTQWILSKNELQYNDVAELKITEGLGADREDLDASLAGLSGGTCFDFQVRACFY